MLPANYYNEYQRNQISTSNQGKLILMMYDGAIKFTSMAIKSIETKDVAKRGKFIQRTHDIINELSCSLDIKKGGDVAMKLDNLYQFIINQLVLANIKSDRKPLVAILEVLTTLREGWEQIINQNQTASTGNDVSPLPAPPQNIKSIASKC